MEETKTAAPGAENPAGTDTQKTTDTQTDENGKKPGDVGKQEENPFEKQLREMKEKEEKLKVDLAKKDEIIDHKNRALEAEKGKNKEKAPLDESAIQETAKKAAQEAIDERDVVLKINAISADPAERELIRKHLESSVVKTGSLDERLKMAVAIANQDLIWTQKQNAALEERREAFLSSFQPSDARTNLPSQTTNPLQKAAEDLVSKINPKAVEHVKKHFE